MQRRENSDAQYQWVQPQTKKRSKSVVLTNKCDEDRTRRTSLSQRKPRTSVQTLHRRASKVSRSEDQNQKWSTTAFPGKERRSEQQTVPISRGSSRKYQLQEIRIRLYNFIIYSFEQVVERIIAGSKSCMLKFSYSSKS
ncbi:hypothetical protein TNCV_1125841 [Trichonephila clavipes]|nr:hypothetical protein TNCV_1125841 [Trichonephila clavipes]